MWDLPLTTLDDYNKAIKEGGEYWCIDSSTHIKEALIKVEEIPSKLYNIKRYKIKLKTKKCEKTPILVDLP